jgi:2-polyprenyl-3-methyl-5-hydroxy-6-metoxy-1,4-benzoquinol methylase
VTPPELSVIQAAVRRCVGSLGLPAGTRVLDAPCGAGALSLALVENGFDVTALDLDASARAVLGARLLLADLNGPLALADARFDLVCSTEGIEHLESAFAFLRELRRVLRPGGTLLLTTPNTVSLRSRVRFFFSGFYSTDPRPLDESQRHPLHHVGLRTLPELRYMLHTCGFRIERVGATHVKPVSWLYAVHAPWMWLYTRVAFRREKDPAQRVRNREILRQLFSTAALFGENLLLAAKRDDAKPG